MVKRLFILVLGLSLCSCEKEELLPGFGIPVFLKSYINYYGDVSLNAYFKGRQIHVYPIQEEIVWYISPETRFSERPEEFLVIAARNDDRSYNRKETWLMFSARACFADNFKAVHVVCLNAAWDAAHPAGTPLDDVAVMSLTSVGRYVRSGYTAANHSQRIQKRMSEFSQEDLEMILVTESLDIDFDTFPTAAGSYEIKVTMVTIEDEETVVTCTFVVE